MKTALPNIVSTVNAKEVQEVIPVANIQSVISVFIAKVECVRQKKENQAYAHTIMNADKI